MCIAKKFKYFMDFDRKKLNRMDKDGEESDDLSSESGSDNKCD